MSSLDVALNAGAQLQFRQALWAPLYEAVLNILGSTGTILPIGDPKHGQPNATTFSTVGEEQVTFTWSETPNSFDAPLDLTDPGSFQGVVPVVGLNGADEEADSPDAGYWSAGADGTAPNEPKISVGCWVRTDSVSAAQTLLAKRDTTGNGREWEFALTSTGQLRFSLIDESVSGNPDIFTTQDTALTVSTWAFGVATYSGSTTPAGINLYKDGSVVASTDTDDAAYVAMENTTGKVMVAHRYTTPEQLYDGKMAGGPLGPFFVQRELTADEVRRLYELGRRALGL